MKIFQPFIFLFVLLQTFSISFADRPYKNLREHIPNEAIGYLRIPNVWNLIKEPKGSILNSAIEDSSIQNELNSIQQSFFENIIAPDQSEFKSLAQTFLHHLESPIEALIFMPPGMPVPNYLIKAKLNLKDAESYTAWLNSLTNLPDQAFNWDQQLSDQGEAVLILGKEMPLYTKYDFESQSFYAMGGLTVQPNSLNETLELLSPNQPKNFVELEQKTDQSGEGLFLWINTQNLMPMVLMSSPQDKLKLLQDLGVDSISDVSLGWGVSQGKGRFVYAIKTAKDGLSRFIPEQKAEFDFSGRGEISYFVGANFPFHETFKNVIEYYSQQSDQAKYEIEENKKKFQDLFGVSLNDFLASLGNEVAYFSDEIGPFFTLKLSENKKAFYQVLENLPSDFEAKLTKNNYHGNEIFHFTMKNQSWAAIDEAVGSRDNILASLSRIKQHYYWMEEGDYLIFSNIPQPLMDRIKSKEKTSIQTWLKDQQKLDIENTFITLSAKIDQLPQTIFNNYIYSLQILSDLTNSDTNLFTLPSASELNLPKSGAYSFAINRSNKTTSVELSFENSPIDFLYTGDQSSLTAISLIAISAGLVLPQLGKAQDAANRVASNNNIKALCSVVIAETAMSKGSYLRGLWATKKGIRTTTEDDPNILYVDGEPLNNIKPNLEIFASYKGQHPYGGYYVYNGYEKESRGKKKLSSETRIILEVYPFEDGDEQIAIGFADGHVELFDAPSGPLSEQDIFDILSVKGSNTLFPIESVE